MLVQACTSLYKLVQACTTTCTQLAAHGERGARAARVVALQLAPPSPIAARAERADAPAPAAARAPMMMRGLGPFFSVVQGAVTVTQVFGSHVAISGLAIFRYGLA